MSDSATECAAAYSSISGGTISASGEIPRRASCLNNETSLSILLEGLKLDREVAQYRRLPDHAEATQGFAQLVHVFGHFDHVVNVALRVGASRNRDAH